MGMETARIGDRQLSAADCLLEIPHHIEMSDKTHHACFGETDPRAERCRFVGMISHSRNLLSIIIVKDFISFALCRIRMPIIRRKHDPDALPFMDD